MSNIRWITAIFYLKWLISFYKSLVTSLKLNNTFNFYLFQIRIWSDYMFSYLKEGFQYRQELQFQVSNV